MGGLISYRNLLSGSGILRLAGVHNALGAKIAETAGFDGIWVSSLELSASHCLPDAGILAMSDYLSVAKSILSAVNIPVIVDCDTGFGGPNEVFDLVEKFESSGITGVCIEDKKLPKLNSFVSAKHTLVPITEFVDKLKSAKSARISNEFILIARTEALIAGLQIEEALTRAYAYADAGADAILVHSKQPTIEQIASFAEAWRSTIPLVVVPTTYYTVTIKELENIGVKAVIYANQGLRSIIRTLKETYKEIIETGSSASVEVKIAPLKSAIDLSSLDD